MGHDSTSEQRGVRFAKMEGAGNDFILIKAASQNLSFDPGELALAVCPRRTSIGADGLILVEPSQRDDAQLSLRFWNPDGGEIATCGNGTRCAARFAVLVGLAPNEMLIETAGGDIWARVSGGNVTLRFDAQPTYELDLEVTVENGVQCGHRFEIGNHHLVMQVDQLPSGPIEPTCRPLRYAPELAPAGANINLAEVIDRHRIRIRTYERGVEAETLACGSGSLSSAAALCAAGQVDSPVAVETRSGDVLTVRFDLLADGSFSGLELEGPARFVYWGELRDDAPHG